MHETERTDSNSSGPIRLVGTDVLEMLELRRRLAAAELRQDMAAGRRLSIVGGAGAVLALTGLPLLLSAAAIGLNDRWQLGVLGWTLLFGAVALLLGLALLWTAWRRFRSDFVGMKDSLAEMQEDLIWLQERWG